MSLKHNVILAILFCCSVILSFTPALSAQDLDLESINFAFDSDEPVEDLKQIRRIINLINQDEELLVEISAHTDKTGSEEYNNLLSEKRATAVKELLIQKGVPPERIVIKGNAFHSPFTSNKNLEGKLLNRRADFSIFKMKNGQRDYYYKDNLFIKPLVTEDTTEEKFVEKDPSLNNVMDRLNELEALLKEKDQDSQVPSNGRTDFQIFNNQYFSLAGGLGANNGDLLGNVQGKLFIPTTDETFALQGGFNADITEEFQEYQMDAGLVGRKGWLQLGCFASVKFISMDMYEDNATLSQINVTASRMFERGSIGIFFTEAIQDEDVIESRSHYEYADLYTTETYLKVSDKIGVNAAYQFENGFGLYGDIGSQNADDMDLFGSVRATWPLNDTGEWRLFCQADYNSGYLEKDDNYSALIGIELGSPTVPRNSDSTNSDNNNRVRPMVVQDINYELKTRTTALLSDVNHAPSVSINTSTIQGTSPLEVTFTAVASDADGTIVSYEWDFGDGETGSGESVTHAYAASGLYNATLTVTDNKGSVSSASTTVDVINAGPKVSIRTTSIKGGAPHTVTFTASAWDVDGTITAYEWEFGDGATATGEVVTHTFRSPGNYPVVLKVRDNLLRETTSTVMINATGYAPTAAIDYMASSSDPATFSFIGTGLDPDGHIIRYAWNLSDGTYSNNRLLKHTFASPGTYVVNFTAVDSQGMSSTKSITVTVP